MEGLKPTQKIIGVKTNNMTYYEMLDVLCANLEHSVFIVLIAIYIFVYDFIFTVHMFYTTPTLSF